MSSLQDGDHNNDYLINHKDLTLLLKKWNDNSFDQNDISNLTNNWQNDVYSNYYTTPTSTKTLIAKYLDGVNENFADSMISIRASLTPQYGYVDPIIDVPNATINVTVDSSVNDISQIITEMDKYTIAQPVNNDSQRYCRCEITFDGYVKRKDYYVKSLGNTQPYFRFYEKLSDLLNGINEKTLDLNYDSEYGFIGADENLASNNFMIGVYPDTYPVDILKLIKVSDDSNIVSDDQLYRSTFNKKFSVSERANELSCYTGEIIDTLEWYDVSGSLLANQSGNDSKLSGIDTGNSSNNFVVKIKYFPINYLGYKTSSRLFYRSFNNDVNNGQILTNTPHNVVKIFDYSLLDYKYRRHTNEDECYATNLFTDTDNNNPNPISLLEYGANEMGFNLREIYAKSIQRIERLLVFTDERKDYVNALPNFFQNLNTTPHIKWDFVAPTVPGYSPSYSKVGQYDTDTMWRGMSMIRWSTYTNDDINNSIIASAGLMGSYSLSDGQGGTAYTFPAPELFQTSINLSNFNEYVDFDDEAPLVDVITHELIHGLGIIPTRRVYENGTNQIFPDAKTIVRNQHPLYVKLAQNQGYFDFASTPYVSVYDKNSYNKLSNIYAEYINKLGNWVNDTNQSGDERKILTNDLDIPLEAAGGQGTVGGHFEDAGYFVDVKNYYIGMGNELMIGQINSNPPYGIITGMTIQAAADIVENGIQLFKVIRKDGELITTNDIDEAKVQSQIIPWHKPSSNDNYFQLGQLITSSAHASLVANSIFGSQLANDIFGSQLFQFNIEIDGQTNTPLTNQQRSIILPSNDTRARCGCGMDHSENKFSRFIINE